MNMRQFVTLLVAGVLVSLQYGCANMVYHVDFRARSFAGAPPEGKIEPAKPNVVLVYGFSGTAATMVPMREKLMREGFNVLVPDMGLQLGGVESFTESLVEFMSKKERELAERTGKSLAQVYDDVVFFCHSQGGLICADAQRRDRKLLGFPVISAGTVYVGSPLAVFTFALNGGSNKLPGSPWLTELRKDMKTHPRRLLQVTAMADELIPASMNVIPDYPLYVAPFAGHMTLLYELDPAVFKSQLPKHFPSAAVRTVTPK
jgi:hypothetical protein